MRTRSLQAGRLSPDAQLAMLRIRFDDRYTISSVNGLAFSTIWIGRPLAVSFFFV
jgi:hypothetical protein